MSGQSSSSATAVQFLYQVVYARGGCPTCRKPAPRWSRPRSASSPSSSRSSAVFRRKSRARRLACLRTACSWPTRRRGHGRRRHHQGFGSSSARWPTRTSPRTSSTCTTRCRRAWHDVEFRRVQEGIDGRQARVVVAQSENFWKVAPPHRHRLPHHHHRHVHLHLTHRLLLYRTTTRPSRPRTARHQDARRPLVPESDADPRRRVPRHRRVCQHHPEGAAHDAVRRARGDVHPQALGPRGAEAR